MNTRTLLSVTLLGGALLLAGPAARAEATNLVANGNFAQTPQDRPQYWEALGDSELVTQTLRVMTDRQGKRCAQLSCTRFERQTPSAHAMLAQVGQVRLSSGRTYEFSCDLRAEGISGQSVSVAISDTKHWQNCGLQGAFPLGTTWRTYRRVFKASQDVGSDSRLQLWFTETGTLYVANVHLAECAPETTDFTDVVPAAGGKNLLPNASFELGASGWSSLGAGAGWGNLAGLHGRIETSGGQHGGSFLRIPLGGEHTPVLYFDYYEPVVRRELHPLAASRGWLRVEPGVAYTLSGYLRASRAGVPAALGVVAQEPAGQRREHRTSLALTTEWQRYSLTFKPAQRYVFVVAGPDLAREESVTVDLDALQLERGERATAFEPRQALEWALEPSEPGGIFTNGQPGALWLRACNHSPNASRLELKFQVTDFADQPVPFANQAWSVAAGTNFQVKLPLPREWQGYFRVNASAPDAPEAGTAALRLAWVPRRTAPDSVLGINHAFVTADLMALAAKAGVTWYRDWSLKWQHLEPAPGQYHWEIGDTQINRVLQTGAAVLPLLPPFPSADWSSEAPSALSTKGYPGVRARQAWGPKDPPALAGFIERAVARYRDRIHLWEFLNEPLYTDYALPSHVDAHPGARTYQPADYVALLRLAAKAMRQTDPACRVIGGVAGGPRQLTHELLDAGILSQLDYLNLHLYPGLRAPEAYAAEMEALLRDMDAHGGRKPIWITEFSYYGADVLPRRPFVPQPNAWAEERLLDSERQCADFTVRFFTVMLAHGAEKIFIHSGASGTVNAPDFECALFDYGGAPRKLLPALAVLTELLGPAPKCAGADRVGQAGQIAAFETGRNALLVLWRTEPDPDASFPAPRSPSLRWLDAMGRTMAGPPARLSSSPTYLVGPSGTARDLLQQVIKAAGKATN